MNTVNNIQNFRKAKISLLSVFLFLIPFPLFFKANGAVFTGTSLDQDSFSIPVSVFFLLMVFFSKPVFLKNLVKSNFCVFIFFVINILVFLLTSLTTSDINPLLYLVSNIPMFFSYAVGVELTKYNNKYLLEKIDILVMLVTVVTFLHIVSSFISYGVLNSFIMRGEDSFFGLFSIYQKVIYYPTMISCFFVISLYRKKKYQLIYSAIIFLDVLMIGSRESIVLCVLGLVSVLFYNSIKGKKNKNLRFLFVATAIIFFLSFFVQNLTFNEDVAVIRKFLSLSESNDLSAGRAGAISKIFTQTGSDFHLFTGTGFSMVLGDLRSPHNQFLEFYLRGGFFSVFMLLVIIISALKKGLGLLKAQNVFLDVFYPLFVVFFLLSFVSFNINTPVRAPFTSVLYGLLLGVILSFNRSLYEQKHF